MVQIIITVNIQAPDIVYNNKDNREVKE